jgi:hypothetical protein
MGMLGIRNKKKLPPMDGQGTEWVNVPTAGAQAFLMGQT